MIKLIKNVAFDVVIYSLVAYSLTLGTDWQASAATNIVYFLSAVSAVSAFCMLLMDKKTLKNVAAKYKEKTAWHIAYSNVTCLFEIIVLASLGWWWCCAAFVLNAAGRSRLDDIAKED